MASKRTIAAAFLFGAASIGLYALLLHNSQLFVELAQRTKNGEKSLFIIPVFVAFIFSYVHGTFTGHFWESLGLRASNQVDNKNK